MFSRGETSYRHRADLYELRDKISGRLEKSCPPEKDVFNVVTIGLNGTQSNHCFPKVGRPLVQSLGVSARMPQGASDVCEVSSQLESSQGGAFRSGEPSRRRSSEQLLPIRTDVLDPLRRD